jgi:hypothetical protein
MFIYETGPIDHWRGWTSLEDYVGCLQRDGVAERRHLFDFMFRAFTVASRCSHWEGDIRYGHVFVSGMPPEHCDCSSYLVIAWKQDNNGTTFIASEKEISYLLEAYCPQPEPQWKKRLVSTPSKPGVSPRF